MRIDISIYEAQKSAALDYFNSKGRDVHKTISHMASYRFVPCIATAYWLGPETQWSPEVLMAIQMFVDFYGYTQVDGKPEGAPF